MYISLTRSVYQKKWKISVLLLFKSKLLWKLKFDDENLTKLWRESEKTLVKWFWRVLAESRWISKHGPERMGKGGGIEMEILLNWVRKKLRVLAGIVFQGSNAMLFSMANLANANYWMAWRIYVSILFRFHYEDQDIVLWKYFTPFSSVSIFTFGMCLLGSSV